MVAIVLTIVHGPLVGEGHMSK